jgi:hypothetical protein
VLHQSGEALHPVTIVAVENAVDLTNFGVVNVAADHTMCTALTRLFGHSFFKVAHITDGAFDLEFQVT